MCECDHKPVYITKVSLAFCVTIIVHFWTAFLCLQVGFVVGQAKIIVHGDHVLCGGPVRPAGTGRDGEFTVLKGPP